MDNMIQTMCEACEQVLTFPAHETTPRFCSVCTEEFDEMLGCDIGDADIDAWAEFWEAKDHAGELEYEPREDFGYFGEMGMMED